MEYSSSEISKSRKEALKKIEEVLDKGDLDEQFKSNNGDYYSSNKFLLVWKGNYHGMACEMRIDKTDSFYASMTGSKAIYACVGLFHEKQLESYPTIERAFIDVGLKLCSNRSKKKEFFIKYAQPYNERLKVAKTRQLTKL